MQKFRIIIPPPPSHVPQHELDQLAEGDHEVFQKLYTNFGGRLYHYVLVLTADEAVAEDIVQEIFLNVWRKRKLLKRVNNFNAYLHVMGRNLIMNYRNKRRREKDFLQQQKEQVQHCFTDTNGSELARFMAEAVADLPLRQRQVYTLKNELNWKRAEIAKALDISVCTVKAHLQKAAQAVRAYVELRIEDKSLSR